MFSSWSILFMAGLSEVLWLVSLKQTNGFTRFWPTCMTVAGMVLSMVLLSKTLNTIPLGTAYAVWTGIGAAGSVLVGALWFHEAFGIWRLACVGMIVVGIIGLKLTAQS